MKINKNESLLVLAVWNYLMQLVSFLQSWRPLTLFGRNISLRAERDIRRAVDAVGAYCALKVPTIEGLVLKDPHQFFKLKASRFSTVFHCIAFLGSTAGRKHYVVDIKTPVDAL